MTLASDKNVFNCYYITGKIHAPLYCYWGHIAIVKLHAWIQLQCKCHCLWHNWQLIATHFSTWKLLHFIFTAWCQLATPADLHLLVWKVFSCQIYKSPYVQNRHRKYKPSNVDLWIKYNIIGMMGMSSANFLPLDQYVPLGPFLPTWFNPIIDK